MYNADQLHVDLMKTFQDRYPGFRAMRFIFSSVPGGGKSTVLASVPIPKDKKRICMDNEDSMAYLDAGPDGIDILTPNRLQFRMHRKAFPTLEDYSKYYQGIKKGSDAGAFCIDNIAIMQDLIVQWMSENTSNYQKMHSMFASFDAVSSLPNAGIVTKVWARGADGSFWAAAKAIPRQIILTCIKQGVHFLGTTEEGNVWEGYGTPSAKITGKKAKLWDVWLRYTDAVISLTRNVNSREAPMGELYANQPKMRLQGMNPRFPMDWERFVKEIEASAKRSEKDIPEEFRVKEKQNLYEDANE